MMKPMSSVLRLRMTIAVAALLLILVAAGCMPFGRGAYPIDVFAEMHYTQMYKSQEPPRLYPAPGAVPFMPVGHGALVVPDESPAIQAATAEEGRALYAVNCVVCHGEAGTGDGPLSGHLARIAGAQALAPADLTGAGTVAASDEDLFIFIGGGGRIGNALRLAGQDATAPTMPVFNKMLTEEERWSLVRYLRHLQGQ